MIDWAHYVAEVHFPSVVERGRVRTSPVRPSGPNRETRMRSAVLSSDRQLAVFDLEHTLIASNVVDSYAWLASRHIEADRRVGFVADLIGSAPRWLALDRRDRGDFLRSFYRRYEGASVDQVRADAMDLFHQFLLPRSFPSGLARVRHHRRLGHRTLLITGALDVVVEPLAPLFDDVVCAHLSAVNPDARLAAIARRRGWLVEHWKRASGGTASFLPLGSLEKKSLVADPGAGGSR